jgi:hypothetical protein
MRYSAVPLVSLDFDGLPDADALSVIDQEPASSPTAC